MMEPKPADSPCSSVQALLSPYLDGKLSPIEGETVERHLQQCPHCVDLYMDLRSLQVNLATLEANTPVPALEGLWATLAETLSEDRALGSAPCPYDAVFVSTYHDGAVEDAGERQAFESHLVTCDGCNAQLADLREVSDTLRGFGHRLEAQCDIDLTEAVLGRLQPQASPLEATDSGLMSPCGALSLVTLSAYTDSALPPAEMVQVGGHVEACGPCREALTDFNQLAAVVQDSISRQVDPPDCWPAIEAALKVLPLRRPTPLRRRLAVAAASVGLLMIPALSTWWKPGTQPTTTQLAALPTTVNSWQAPPNVEAEPVAVKYLSSATASSRAPLRHPPMAAGWQAPPQDPAVPVMAVVRPPRPTTTVDGGVFPGPSAEDYLFQSTRSDLPTEEVPVILGLPGE